jgi:hypothetical protein
MRQPRRDLPAEVISFCPVNAVFFRSARRLHCRTKHAVPEDTPRTPRGSPFRYWLPATTNAPQRRAFPSAERPVEPSAIESRGPCPASTRWPTKVTCRATAGSLLTSFRRGYSHALGRVEHRQAAGPRLPTTSGKPEAKTARPRRSRRSVKHGVIEHDASLTSARLARRGDRCSQFAARPRAAPRPEQGRPGLTRRPGDSPSARI